MCIRDRVLRAWGVNEVRQLFACKDYAAYQDLDVYKRQLMQNPAFLMMDDPTSSLDFGNQMRVLAQICALARRGVGVVMTSHFPDHAFLCCDKAAVMSRTEPFRVDAIENIVTEDVLENAYGIPVKIASIDVPEHPDGSVTTCVPLLKTKAHPCPCDSVELPARFEGRDCLLYTSPPTRARQGLY